MIRKEIVIHQPEGLHSRPAALLVQVACKFQARVLIEQGGKVINAKSMMGVLSLGVGSQDKTFIITDGVDEQQAAEAILALVQSGFTKVS